jgi:hypothetical protein
MNELNLHWIVTDSIWLADKVVSKQISVLYGRYENVEIDKRQCEIVVNHQTIELEGLLTEKLIHFLSSFRIKLQVVAN